MGGHPPLCPRWFANCCTGSGATTDCSDCDFYSLYLSEVEGEFQLGDKIQITWDSADTPGAETIHNYIDSISTYYNTGRTQQAEEQVLKITFPGAHTSAKADATRFQGYFSLTYTDDFGDEYTTEAISVSVAGTCNPNRFATNGLGDCDAVITTPSPIETEDKAGQDAGYFGVTETVCTDATADGGRGGAWTAWTTECGTTNVATVAHTPATGTNPFDESLYGDFVIHSQNLPQSAPGVRAATGSYYRAPKMEAAPQDYAGGNLVADKIEEALEALPNGVTGDVIVDYAYNGFVNSNGWLAANTGAACADGNDATAAAYLSCGEGALTRNFVIRFLDSSGDIKPLKVNYAFSTGGLIYSNQGCGSRGVLTSAVVTDPGDRTDGTLAYAFSTNVVCDKDPILTLNTGDGKLNTGVVTASALLDSITIDHPGVNCVVTGASAATLSISNVGGTGGANDATVAITFSNDGSDEAFDCLNTAKGEATAAYFADDTAKAEILDSTTETSVTAGTFYPTFETVGNTKGNEHGNDPYDSSMIWGRNGVADGLGRTGTTENVECSNRGSCDYTTGECACFTGFSAKDCSVQNSLASGSSSAPAVTAL
jgi:hypothetical protein